MEFHPGILNFLFSITLTSTLADVSHAALPWYCSGLLCVFITQFTVRHSSACSSATPPTFPPILASLLLSLIPITIFFLLFIHNLS